MPENSDSVGCTFESCLAFLIRHPGQVFSREDLYELIWELESMGDNITVAVHIGRIRDKIEDDPATPRLLQTVWGVGYRFNKEVQRICGFFMHLGLHCLRD